MSDHDINAKTDSALPNLVFIGDVAVECSYHGSALLFRLLQNYPPTRLKIIESDFQISLPERRLPEVSYEQFPIGWNRWLSTRFHSIVNSWLSITAGRRSALLPSLLRGYQAQSVLTVGHGFSWLTAADFALRMNLPLHLIVHDDWPRVAQLAGFSRQWLDDQFGRVYRQAVTRLCVSPFMAAEYERRYGAKASVLYPSRAAAISDAPAITSRISNSQAPLVYGFAGSINSPGYVRALKDLSGALMRNGGQLNIYGPLTEEQAELNGLSRANVRLCGLLPSNDLIEALRDNIDVLFLPMSFAAEDYSNMSLGFPSKLTDYTATGLPLLIYGPAYSTAVCWANENSPVAEVVTEEGLQALSHSVEKLLEVDYRKKLGAAAIRVGKKYFDHNTAQKQFFKHLLVSVQD